MMIADLTLSPGGILSWIVVGLVAGWLAGVAMRGHGFGILRDVIVGLIGALVGGFLGGFFVSGNTGFIGSIVVALIGACVLIAVVNVFSRRGTYNP